MKNHNNNSELASESFGTESGSLCETPFVPAPRMSRRSFLAKGSAVGATLLMSRMITAQTSSGADAASVKEYDIVTNGITLHVTEQGEGPAVLFCHGFPDTSYTWRRQIKAISAAGYRAVAPDMRGYGRSSAPSDLNLYTPLQTTGDLVGLLDALKIQTAVLVGHDWGATHAWNAALMRPDRFSAVFCMSVPYVPRGDVSVFDKMRKAGHEHDFYMFEQMSPAADQIWANAAVTIPGVLYWASGSAPAETRWTPLAVFTVPLQDHCPPGRRGIMSNTTSRNFNAQDSTADSIITAQQNPISPCPLLGRVRR